MDCHAPDSATKGSFVHKESDTTEQQQNNTTTLKKIVLGMSALIYLESLHPPGSLKPLKNDIN